MYGAKAFAFAARTTRRQMRFKLRSHFIMHGVTNGGFVLRQHRRGKRLQVVDHWCQGVRHGVNEAVDRTRREREPTLLDRDCQGAGVSVNRLVGCQHAGGDLRRGVACLLPWHSHSPSLSSPYGRRSMRRQDDKRDRTEHGDKERIQRELGFGPMRFQTCVVSVGKNAVMRRIPVALVVPIAKTAEQGDNISIRTAMITMLRRVLIVIAKVEAVEAMAICQEYVAFMAITVAEVFRNIEQAFMLADGRYAARRRPQGVTRFGQP